MDTDKKQLVADLQRRNDIKNYKYRNRNIFSKRFRNFK